MKHIVVCLGLLVPGYLATALAIEPQSQATSSTESCFLLFELGVGEVRRGPAEACRTRVTPASTFKVPHALAALEEQQSFLEVVRGPAAHCTSSRESSSRHAD